METFLLKTTNGTPFQQEMKSEILYNSCSEANTYFGSSCSKLVPRSKLEAYLVFVNPEFTLYQAPFDQSLIFPTQLKRYIQKLNMMPSKFTIRHTKLAQELISRHLPESSWERLPEYHYNQLRKGIICSSCQGFLGRFSMGSLRCQKCALKEQVDSVVIRAVAEFHLLFPEKRITATKIFNWCNKIVSQKSIRRILKRNMVLVGEGRGAHYKFN